ncbi:hypothetical protein Glove_139g42 [Diversispora epigaea]|uniref:Uncharacterized protein n=1 Tax=Diversispora epigaea TaxID=1348612 RepID=A0A397J4U9_9GLOM|nr:hypothetical protein Glove_139g42 [Diversispora epigaea]
MNSFRNNNNNKNSNIEDEKYLLPWDYSDYDTDDDSDIVNQQNLLLSFSGNATTSKARSCKTAAQFSIFIMEIYYM